MEKREIIQETSALLRAPHRNSVIVNGHKYEIMQGVFSPATFPSTAYYAEQLPVRRGHRVLEIGTGTGIIAIEATYKGAGHVCATDINQKAVANAESNVARHNLADRVIVMQSDVFENIPRQKFDIIFWSMPFGYVKRPAIDMLELAAFDQEYASIRKYFAQAKAYLAGDGLLLFGFSRTIGSEAALDCILQEHNLRKQLLSEKILQEGRPVDFGLYRATNNEKEK